MMIRRGRTQADRFHGDLYVVYVQQDELSPADQQILDQNLAAAREANAHVEILDARRCRRQHSRITPRSTGSLRSSPDTASKAAAG